MALDEFKEPAKIFVPMAHAVVERYRPEKFGDNKFSREVARALTVISAKMEAEGADGIDPEAFALAKQFADKWEQDRLAHQREEQRSRLKK